MAFPVMFNSVVIALLCDPSLFSSSDAAVHEYIKLKGEIDTFKKETLELKMSYLDYKDSVVSN